MFLLLIVILLNTYVFTTFKLFDKYKVNALQAITVNYWTCVATGLFTHGIDVMHAEGSQQWMWHGVIMGIYFIALFNVISYSTRREGIAATTIANKLSLVIPVVFSFWLYNEPAGVLKIAGILLALPAVYLASSSKDNKSSHLLLPATVFVFSGLLDTYLKYMQQVHLLTEQSQAAFSIICFGMAACVGTVLVAGRLIIKKERFTGKSIVAGVLLGVPNYFSIYLLIRLFESDVMSSSAIIPVNNIGIMVVTTLVAILAFKEQASAKRYIGIALSVISIILIALAR